MKITENSTQEQELFKTLSLPTQDRGTDGIIYLNRIYSLYIKLILKRPTINN